MEHLRYVLQLSLGMTELGPFQFGENGILGTGHPNGKTQEIFQDSTRKLQLAVRSLFADDQVHFPRVFDINHIALRTRNASRGFRSLT